MASAYEMFGSPGNENDFKEYLEYLNEDGTISEESAIDPNN